MHAENQWPYRYIPQGKHEIIRDRRRAWAESADNIEDRTRRKSKTFLLERERERDGQPQYTSQGGGGGDREKTMNMVMKLIYGSCASCRFFFNHLSHLC